jgi:hypothetical protein
MWQNPVFVNMATQVRHYDIVLCIATQYINKIPPTFRESAFQTALFWMASERSLKAAYESYGSDFGNYDEFKAFNNSKLGDHKFLFVNQYDKATKPAEELVNENLVLIAPPVIPPFKLFEPTAKQLKAPPKVKTHPTKTDTRKRKR